MKGFQSDPAQRCLGPGQMPAAAKSTTFVLVVFVPYLLFSNDHSSERDTGLLQSFVDREHLRERGFNISHLQAPVHMVIS